MFNKKAQSQIITTVLIILLVLAAIVIVWQVVQTTVTESAEEIPGQTDCLTIDLEMVSAATLGACTFTEGGTCDQTGVTEASCVASTGCTVPTWGRTASTGNLILKRGVGSGDLAGIRIFINGVRAAGTTSDKVVTVDELGQETIDIGDVGAVNTDNIKIAKLVGTGNLADARLCEFSGKSASDGITIS